MMLAIPTIRAARDYNGPSFNIVINFTTETETPSLYLKQITNDVLLNTLTLAKSENRVYSYTY